MDLRDTEPIVERTCGIAKETVGSIDCPVLTCDGSVAVCSGSSKNEKTDLLSGRMTLRKEEVISNRRLDLSNRGTSFSYERDPTMWSSPFFFDGIFSCSVATELGSKRLMACKDGSAVKRSSISSSLDDEDEEDEDDEDDDDDDDDDEEDARRFLGLVLACFLAVDGLSGVALASVSSPSASLSLSS